MAPVRILFAAKTHLDGITHEQTIVCRQLFADHVVGSQPMKRGKNSSNDNNIYLLLVAFPFLTSQLKLLIGKFTDFKFERETYLECALNTFCYHHSQQKSTNCSYKSPLHGQILLEVICISNKKFQTKFVMSITCLSFKMFKLNHLKGIHSIILIINLTIKFLLNICLCGLICYKRGEILFDYVMFYKNNKIFQEVFLLVPELSCGV